MLINKRESGSFCGNRRNVLICNIFHNIIDTIFSGHYFYFILTNLNCSAEISGLMRKLVAISITSSSSSSSFTSSTFSPLTHTFFVSIVVWGVTAPPHEEMTLNEIIFDKKYVFNTQPTFLGCVCVLFMRILLILLFVNGVMLLNKVKQLKMSGKCFFVVVVFALMFIWRKNDAIV